MRVKGRFVKRSTEQAAKGRFSIPSIPESEVLTPESSVTDEGTLKDDEEMPDVSDPEAGFCPTDDQPFRRVRRHTIT
jgi:hypothetical protein